MTIEQRNTYRIHPQVDMNIYQQKFFCMSYLIPVVYVFRVISSIPDVKKKYLGVYCKVGDTHRDIGIRLTEWALQLRVYNNDPNLIVELLDVYPLMKYLHLPISKINPMIRDYQVHKELVKLGWERLENEDLGSDEFFKAPTSKLKVIRNNIRKCVKNVFAGIDSGLYTLNESCVACGNEKEPAFERVKSRTTADSNNCIAPRFYQTRAINNCILYWCVHENKIFLINHDPRTGKTYTALWTINEWFSYLKKEKQKDICFCIITTAMPSVVNEWRKTNQEHKDFENTIFARKVKDQNKFEYWYKTCIFNANTIEDLYTFAKQVKYDLFLFLSVQDLVGQDTNQDFEITQTFDVKTVKERYHILFNKNKHLVDAVIVDEAHCAALNPTSKSGQMIQEIINANNAVRLDVSATPYRAYYNDIYNWNDENCDVFRMKDFLSRKYDSLSEEEKPIWQQFKELFPSMYTICPIDSFDFWKSCIMSIENGSKEDMMKTFPIIWNALYEDFSKSGLGIFENPEIFKKNFLCQHGIVTVKENKEVECAAITLAEYCNRLNKYIKIYIPRSAVSSEGLNNIMMHSNIIMCETVEEYKNYLKSENRTILITCDKWLTGTTVPEPDIFIVLRTMSSAERYDQYTNRIYNPCSGKQNVIVWNWNKDAIFKIAAFKAGFLKSGKIDGDDIPSFENFETIGKTLEAINIIIPSGRNEYIQVTEKDVASFAPEAYFNSSNKISTTKFVWTKLFSYSDILFSFLSTIKKSTSKEYIDTLYEEGSHQDDTHSLFVNLGRRLKKKSGNPKTDKESEENISDAITYLNDSLSFIAVYISIISNSKTVLCTIDEIIKCLDVNPEIELSLSNDKVLSLIIKFIRALTAAYCKILNRFLKNEIGNMNIINANTYLSEFYLNYFNR